MSAIRSETLVPDLPENATVKLIGLGGIGGIVARYGSLFLGSLGRPVRMVLVDGDSFESSNQTRMFFGRNGNKAAVTRDDLVDRFADSPLSVLALEEYVTPENIERVISNGDIVLLAVDNHATRKLVNDHCAGLEDVVLISGGNDGIEDAPGAVGPRSRGTYGNCQIYIRRDGQDRSPSLTRFHPEIRNPQDALPTDKSCTELVASVPQILFANLSAASAILNAFWLYLCGSLHYSEVAFDIADGRMQPVPIPAPKALAEGRPPRRR
jgi:molybdopterin/thiamine biosynthesis adenylyltransferase